MTICLSEFCIWGSVLKSFFAFRLTDIEKEKHPVALSAMLYAVQIQFSIKQISICIAYNVPSICLGF